MAGDRPLTYRTPVGAGFCEGRRLARRAGSTGSHPSRVARSLRRCPGCRSVRPRACARCMPTPPRVGRHRSRIVPHLAAIAIGVVANFGGVGTGFSDPRVARGTSTSQGGERRTIAPSSPCVGRGSRAPRACARLFLTIDCRYWTFG